MLRTTSGLVALGAMAMACAVQAASAPAANSLGEERIAPEASIDSPFGKYLAGLYARFMGESGDAARFYGDALSLDEQNAELKRSAYRLMLAAGSIDEGVALARAIAGPGDDGLAALAVGIAALRAGDLAAAEKSFEAMTAAGMNALLRPTVLAWLRVGQGRAEDAIDELASLQRSEQSKAFRLYHVALIYALTDQREEADVAFQELIGDADTRSLRAVQAYAVFLLREGRRDEAVALLDEHVPEDATNAIIEDARSVLDQETHNPFVASAAQGIAEALHTSSRFMAQNGERETATIYARLALYLSPNLEVARVLLGNILESAAQWEEAIETYGEVQPDTALGWAARLRVAACLRRLERTDEAMAMLREMAEERPERPDALIDLADMLRADEKWVEAVDAYDRAIARSGAPSERNWGLYYSRGIALERSQQWERAEKDFLLALEIQPDQPQVLNYLGYSWVEQGMNLDRAKGMLEKAVELRPRDGYIVDSLGWVMYRLGNYEAAVEHLERAVALQPADPVINEHLGDAYWRVGRQREARFQWERALTFEPEDEQIPAIRRKLSDGLTDI